METSERTILNAFLDKYEKSKLSKGKIKTNRVIKLTPNDEVLSTYLARDSYKYSDNNDQIIRKLENMGFIRARFENDVFCEAVLNLNNVNEIYKYTQRENPKDELLEIGVVLNGLKIDERIYPFISFVEKWIDEKGDFPKRYFSDSKELKLILKVMNDLLNLEEEMRERDFSVRYLGDSKKFSSIKNKIINIARDFIFGGDEDNDSVLTKLNISKNTTYAIIKNKLLFKLGEIEIDLNNFNYEFCLSDQMIKDITILKSDVQKVITVENLTSFHSLQDDDALIIYLAGFHNHTKQMLLHKIHESYPNAKYYHFGDIDAGGFWIFESLCSKTGIEFKPYRMGIGELKENSTKLKKLTENDIARLGKMVDDKRFLIFKETIEFMLKNNIKLEQEILD